MGRTVRTEDDEEDAATGMVATGAKDTGAQRAHGMKKMMMMIRMMLKKIKMMLILLKKKMTCLPRHCPRGASSFFLECAFIRFGERHDPGTVLLLSD